MSTDPNDLGHDSEVSEGDAPQALRVFTEPTEADVPLDPSTPAFDRVQDEKTVDEDYEAEYNRRYVKEHGDHREPKGPEAE